MGIKLFDYDADNPREQRIYYFRCPACRTHHPLHVPGWTWNGSWDRPTFTPSLLVYPFERGPMSKLGNQPRCHSFITDGQIQFCGDSEHSMAGQTVEIPDWTNEETED